jgi:hypothetical protein
MIGVTPPSNGTTLHVIEGGLFPSYMSRLAVEPVSGQAGTVWQETKF